MINETEGILHMNRYSTDKLDFSILKSLDSNKLKSVLNNQFSRNDIKKKYLNPNIKKEILLLPHIHNSKIPKQRFHKKDNKNNILSNINSIWNKIYVDDYKEAPVSTKKKTNHSQVPFDELLKSKLMINQEKKNTTEIQKHILTQVTIEKNTKPIDSNYINIIKSTLKSSNIVSLNHKAYENYKKIKLKDYLKFGKNNKIMKF